MNVKKGYYCPDCGVISEMIEQRRKGYVYVTVQDGIERDVNIDNTDCDGSTCVNCGAGLPGDPAYYYREYIDLDGQKFVAGPVRA